MTAGRPRTNQPHPDRPATPPTATTAPTEQAATRETPIGSAGPVASPLALDLRSWAAKVDRAVDELYIQIGRIPALIEEGGERGARRSSEDIRRSAQRPE